LASRLAAARRAAIDLAKEVTPVPVLIWVSKSGQERYFVLKYGQTPPVTCEVVDRVIITKKGIGGTSNPDGA